MSVRKVWVLKCDRCGHLKEVVPGEVGEMRRFLGWATLETTEGEWLYMDICPRCQF